ncbi:DUF2530 domain-containing protein [Streptomyces alkaliphilus]|uniref:DUF2530 domain-containing protein n=1 Tax=Streptomyces alkaliphilus TaxID=1472722 RepID=A0A7W3TEV4_9ACTN|nr:DUF2530 domain-containing protein [Streptomyces alkaliphilus]MBB0245235.1 DUF2530 domain-containing protein [Streptomyces alkaliphilus]
MPRDFLTHDKRKAPEPLEGNIPTVVLVLTVAWGVLLLGSLPFHSRLADHDAQWWIWSCGAGVLMGLYGLWFVHRREAALRRAARTTPSADSGDRPEGSPPGAPTGENPSGGEEADAPSPPDEPGRGTASDHRR